MDVTTFPVRDLQWRGYPVTLISGGALATVIRTDLPDLLSLLALAKDTAEPDEPSGWLFEADVDGTKVWIERFGGVRDFTTSQHEGGQWSIYLPSER